MQFWDQFNIEDKILEEQIKCSGQGSKIQGYDH